LESNYLTFVCQVLVFHMFYTHFLSLFCCPIALFTYICCLIVAQLVILLPTYQFDGSQMK
jgi:hypothetical protein